MRIVVGSDHAGFDLKGRIRNVLEADGHDVTDAGCDSADSCDYPDYAHAAAAEVSAGRAERAVLVCGSGIGMSMAANRHRGVRAAVVADARSARLARRHNDANVLCLGARIVDADQAIEILRAFMETSYEGGRHDRRVAKIEPERG
ncbi:MAG: ribose 5-phosphate isomerase B [Myxococcota bacterium]|nr:ribose 5-phosphate isomerase B [Myxococcota bacterium]